MTSQTEPSYFVYSNSSIEDGIGFRTVHEVCDFTGLSASGVRSAVNERHLTKRGFTIVRADWSIKEVKGILETNYTESCL